MKGNESIMSIPDLNNHPSDWYGLTKREHMAIEFTKAICANPHSYELMNEQQLVEFGISLADKLIQQLNKEK